MCSNPDFCLFLRNEQSCHTDPRSWEMTLPWCWQLSSDGTWTLLLLPEVVCYPPGPEGMWFGESYSLFSCLIELLAKTSYALFGQPLVGISSKGRDFFSIFRIPPVWALIPAPWFMSLLIGLMKTGEKLSFLRRPQTEVSEGIQWPHRGRISPSFSWNGGVVDFKPILIKHLLHTTHGGRNHANVISLSPYHLSETRAMFHRRGKSDSGEIRRHTEVRLACWWWSPDSNPGLLTPKSDSFHTHPGPALCCQAPSLPKRRPLRCFVSLKANQKNSLQFTAGISSIALWVFWWECIQGPITLSEIDTFPIKESNQNLAS